MLSLLQARLRLNELARNWLFWSRKIAEAARKILGPCETYVFGSIVKNCAAGGSDIDILIVSNQLPEDFRSRGNLKAKIEEEAGLPLYHPFEIHLASVKEARENPVYRTAILEAIAV
ncbi:MAG: nucleotidyltransferase domain-containing protein [Crenarchaeota archaeon]|nr:nucleotidyltransferase domain-containing protein [Thermoproteota archaeon]MDW8034254.1 nucleotidyltransferase domain-containing protein [Nitrososphaerota archaeon]